MSIVHNPGWIMKKELFQSVFKYSRKSSLFLYKMNEREFLLFTFLNGKNNSNEKFFLMEMTKNVAVKKHESSYSGKENS